MTCAKRSQRNSSTSCAALGNSGDDGAVIDERRQASYLDQAKIRPLDHKVAIHSVKGPPQSSGRRKVIRSPFRPRQVPGKEISPKIGDWCSSVSTATRYSAKVAYGRMKQRVVKHGRCLTSFDPAGCHVPISARPREQATGSSWPACTSADPHDDLPWCPPGIGHESRLPARWSRPDFRAHRTRPGLLGRCAGHGPPREDDDAIVQNVTARARPLG